MKSKLISKIFLITCLGGLLLTTVLAGCGRKKDVEQLSDTASERQDDDKNQDPGMNETDSALNSEEENSNGIREGRFNKNDDDSSNDTDNQEAAKNADESSKNTKEMKFRTDSDFLNSNEYDSDLIDLYIQFKENKIKAQMDEKYTSSSYSEDGPLGKEPFDLTDLKNDIKKNYYEIRGIERTDYDISYSYFDCGADGIPEMAVRFSNLDIYCEDDDSYVVYVFKQREDQLYLTYSFECWPRSDTSMDWYGHIWSGGSAGAGDLFTEEGILDAEGRFCMINSEEQLTGWWVNYVDEEGYNEIFTNEEQTLLTVFINGIGGDKYYSYVLEDGDSAQKQQCEQYLSKCEESGIKWITSDEVNHNIDTYRKSLNLPDLIFNCEFKELEWENVAQ